MSADFLDFPDPDILLPQKELPLELDLFPDPFLAYRDDTLRLMSSGGSSSGSTSSHTTPSTPDSSSMPSLDDFPAFSSLPSSDSDCYQDELEYRAPFIPMDDDFPLPLLSPSSSVMWGPQQSPAPPKRMEQHKPEPSVGRNHSGSLSSSLAALLQAKEPRAPPRVILLDHAPHRKHNSNRSHNTSTQRRQTKHASTGEHRPYGSHTATVKVNDRLIKVQVSVSDLGRRPPNDQPFPSPPDPPPKRSLPPRPSNSPKRLKGNPVGDSVLMNLLTSGEDASRGYLCSGKRDCTDRKVLAPPPPPLLASEGELLDSLLCDADLDMLLDLRTALV